MRILEEAELAGKPLPAVVRLLRELPPEEVVRVRRRRDGVLCDLVAVVRDSRGRAALTLVPSPPLA